MTAWPASIRWTLLIGLHAFIFGIAFFGAVLIRFDFMPPVDLRGPLIVAGLLAVGLKLLVFGLFSLFRGWWRYVSLYDVIALAHALAIASALFAVLHLLLLRPEGFPRSIYILDFLLSILFLAGARASLRLVRESLASGPSSQQSDPLLIIGAGDPGDMLLREIIRAPRLPLNPVAILDDTPHTWGLKLHGVPVLGPIDQLEDVVDRLGIQSIIIALEADQQHRVRDILHRARHCGLSPRILPPLDDVLDETPSLKNVRDVSITDLLGRDPVDLDRRQMADFLADRTVLITGAGGSIGAELCRQVARHASGPMILVDTAETPLFHIHRELADDHASRLTPVIADVSEPQRMRHIFERHQPQIILHAAAYKHVPLMERHPDEAVHNNIGGTRVVADLALEYGVQTFVLISTDKAVNPTSIMGATKRISELYIRRLAAQFPDGPRYCTVRFGNVLGSNGSVVPIFRRQIEEGGPITVTHPDMTRYFMTIPEAVQLVLQAASFDSRDDLFILDMGSPVRIADLARDMIRLSGLTEADVPIVYTGIRPGEKLFEELSLDDEALDTTAHDKIFVGRRPLDPPPDFDVQLRALLQAASRGDHPRLRQIIDHLLPGYRAGPRPKEPPQAARLSS